MIIFKNIDIVHDLEQYYSWRKYYTAETDPNSPFYKRVYSEFEFTHAIYDTVIHPQWDEFGSLTLYTKILICHHGVYWRMERSSLQRHYVSL